MSLGSGDFAAYFKAVHGVDPFPWQARLARQVIDGDGWPAMLDLPTGVGKTAALDVAVFALAVDPKRSPRRTVFVIDRRIVVDQTSIRAATIRQALRDARSGVLKSVRDRLVALSGDEERPLVVATLRGGMPRDDGWARWPDQPLIAVSTVDQVGSRLLFRGYGVSDNMLSIHAGLLGEDTLFLLDEVHLSRPFAETLEQVRRYRAASQKVLPERWQVVQMSATPADRGRNPFRLDAQDRRHPPLERRLNASKPTELRRRVEVGGGDETSRRLRFAEVCASNALDLAATGLSTVLVVVNRVDTARHVAATVEGAGPGADVMLLTGRMRPLDKDRVAAALIERIGAARQRTQGMRPLIVVATQCIEAGADFDVDGLVTECASLDALRQRFGRLNRRGEAPRCAARALIRADQAKDSEDDPVYGSALAETWRWLETQGSELDFGISALELPDDEETRARLCAPAPRAPVLLPTHLDLWVQTNPRPDHDPVVAHWLHGPDRQLADIQVVWRADLTEEDLRDAEVAKDLVAACPPGSIEALSLPIYTVRAWLAKIPVDDGSDVEGERLPIDERRRGDAPSRLALRWSGDESTVVQSSDLRPGDTIVVPAGYRGLNRHRCWDPGSAEPVEDLGDLVQWRQRGRPTVRLDRRALAPWITAAAPVPLPNPAEAEDVDLERDITDSLRAIAEATPHPWLKEALEHLDDPRQRRRVTVGASGNRHHVVCARRRVAVETDDAEEVTTEDDGAGAFTSVEVSLATHSGDVERLAREFASRCQLSSELVEDLALAGFIHDLGKVDPRFQQMLCGGSEAAAALLEAPLAKSAVGVRDAQARRWARERSGYPAGGRHELLSVALVQEAPAIRERARDWDLVLHLVGSHHGWCRPFAPPVPDPEGPSVSYHLWDAERGVDVVLAASANHGLAALDAGVCDRFWRLVRRYGRYGLAWLEAILRLADHRASEEEQRSTRRRAR